jgi:hypothetical protein
LYELARFDIASMVQCGTHFRRLGAPSNGATSMEEVAARIVRYLHQHLIDAAGRPACALVRFYKTHPHAGLPPGLRAVADAALGDATAAPAMKCLALLASTGDEPAWRSRETSARHKAIPLPTEDAVARHPMIQRLVGQLGLDVGSVLAPAPAFLSDVERRTLGVFHVAEAADSPFVPAQDFVAKHGIRSVVGFGGVLANGDLHAVILFAKVAVARETAELFAPLALGVKTAIHPYVGRVFAAPAAAAESRP